MLLNNLPGAAAVASAHKIVVTTDDGDKTITAEQLRAWAENEAAHPYNYGMKSAPRRKRATLPGCVSAITKP